MDTMMCNFSRFNHKIFVFIVKIETTIKLINNRNLINFNYEFFKHEIRIFMFFKHMRHWLLQSNMNHIETRIFVFFYVYYLTLCYVYYLYLPDYTTYIWIYFKWFKIFWIIIMNKYTFCNFTIYFSIKFMI